MYLIFEGLMCAFVAGLIAVFQNDSALWIILLKTAASLCFVLAGFCGYIRNKGKRTISQTMLMAFICSMAGDVLLALDADQGILFVLGVASFAAAHVLFSLSFCRVSAVTKKDIAGTIALFAALLCLLLLGNFDFQGLLPVLTGYAAVISFMTVKALSLWRCRRERKHAAALTMLGGTLFLLSDIVLLFWLFGIGVPKEVQSVNWVLYYLAQGCLAAAVNQKIRSHE
ncbi:MAG: lysoplasmalogenase [Lachnospiraceae bacterium]|nr:lysoplasmalogenase [Lachnospiraceae bacterium]